TNTTLYGNISPLTAQHELGHNFGLNHSAFINYSGSQDIGLSSCFDPTPINCEYGDIADPMGSGLDQFQTYNKHKLGWISDSDIAIVNSSSHDQIITLAAGDQSSGIRDVVIPLDDGTGYSYHIEYRTADLKLNGVQIRLAKPDTPQCLGRGPKNIPQVCYTF